MSGTRDRRVIVETAKRQPSHTRTRTSASGTGSSFVVVEYSDGYQPLPPTRKQRRSADTDADWEDFESELHPSDSASHIGVPAQEKERPRRKHHSRSRSRSKHHRRRHNQDPPPPPAPEAVPANERSSRRREEVVDYRDYDRPANNRRNSSRTSRRSISDLDHYRDYHEEDMYERRDSRRRYRDDRYYDDRRYDYSPPHSHVTAYSSYPPPSQAAHIVHYQPQYPQYQYSTYPHPGYPMSPPLSSAGGYYPPVMHQFSPHGSAPSQASSSARTEYMSASIRQFQETIEKKQDEALFKQEEYFAHMRAQMDAESATRLARDKAREDEIAKQKRELESKLAADREALSRANELATATEAARVKAEAAAAKKAKEAEDKANKEKEKHEKDLAELKKKNEDVKKAEEALKKERDALIPPADDTRAAVKFKDAGGRTWTFPWKFCKQWKTMQILIVKCYADHPGICAQVEAGRYWLFGPDEQVIMPELWEHTVQPGWDIAMQLWPLPQPREGSRRKKEVVDVEQAAPPPTTHRKEKDKKKSSASSSSRPKSVQPVVVELPDRSKKSLSKRYDTDREEGISPPPPSPPGAGSGSSESAGDIEVVEVITKVDSSERRKRKCPKPENLPLMARWMIGALPRERKR